jgi:prepilin peptidase CpaA
MPLPGFSDVLIIASGIVLIAAALHDIGFRTVPNWMSLVVAGLALARQSAHGHLMASLLWGLCVLAAGLVCWQRGWLGGGDAKLLAATAMLVPATMVTALLIDVALAGGVLALFYLALGRFIRPLPAARPAGLLRRAWRAEQFRIRRRGPLPYASAIAAGALLVLAGS